MLMSCLGAWRAVVNSSSFGQCPTRPMWSEKTEHPGGLGGAKRLTHFLLGETWAACTRWSRDLQHRVHFWMELEWRLLLLLFGTKRQPGAYSVHVRLSESQTEEEYPWQPSLCETRVLIAACHQYNNGMSLYYLNVSLVLNTACPCSPVPCRMNKWLWSPWRGAL